jgi:signal transduction histidine kinase
VKRLYLQVYLTFVASLVLLVVTAGGLWRFIAGVPALDQTFEAVSMVLAEQIPPAGAAPELQQRTVSRLAARFGTDMALYDSSGTRIAAAGEAVPAPKPGSNVDGLIWGASGPAYLMSVSGGRSLVVRMAVHRRRAGLVIVAFLGAIAMAVALCALPVVRQLTRRLERLQSAVDSLGAGDLHARVTVEGRDEVAELAKSFNGAAARIEELVDAHKMLLANASHELRTPLTRLRLDLELAGLAGSQPSSTKSCSRAGSMPSGNWTCARQSTFLPSRPRNARATRPARWRASRLLLEATRHCCAA